MDNANSHLGTERTGKLMRRYAVPCIISLLVGALYNIVDQIFHRKRRVTSALTATRPTRSCSR